MAFFRVLYGGQPGAWQVACRLFSSPAAAASYFTSIDDLFFDSRKELHTDFEHILLDNISRLPIEFLKEECRGVPEALEALRRISEETDYFAKKRLYRELSGLLDDTPPAL